MRAAADLQPEKPAGQASTCCMRFCRRTLFCALWARNLSPFCTSPFCTDIIGSFRHFYTMHRGVKLLQENAGIHGALRFSSASCYRDDIIDPEKLSREIPFRQDCGIPASRACFPLGTVVCGAACARDGRCVPACRWLGRRKTWMDRNRAISAAAPVPD